MEEDQEAVNRLSRRLGELIESSIVHRLRAAGVPELMVDSIRQIYSTEFFLEAARLALQDEGLSLRVIEPEEE